MRMFSKSVSKSGKGISPLIAAVLLIAFTITVAAILATWANMYMKSGTKGLEEKTSKMKKCNSANIKIEDNAIELKGAGDGDETNNNITLRVTNTGKAELKNWKLNIFRKGEINVTAVEPVNDKLIKSKYATLNFVNIGNTTQIEKIELMSSDCPNRATYTCDYEGDTTFSC